jgi:hypothetical protein
MEQLELFDQVQLVEAMALSGEMSNALEPLEMSTVGTIGTIVEVLEPGNNFWVELFGDWVSLEYGAGLVRATHGNSRDRGGESGADAPLASPQRGERRPISPAG